MGSLTRDDNFVPGILLMDSVTSGDVQWKGDSSTGSALVTPTGRASDSNSIFNSIYTSI